MPDIAVPLIASAPGAAIAGIAAAPGSQATSGAEAAETGASGSGVTDFVAQLQAAFAVLAGGLVTSQQPATPGTQTDTAAPPPSDHAPASDGKDQDSAIDQELIALLAALGLTLTPQSIPSAQPSSGPSDQEMGAASVEAIGGKARPQGQAQNAALADLHVVGPGPSESSQSTPVGTADTQAKPTTPAPESVAAAVQTGTETGKPAPAPTTQATVFADLLPSQASVPSQTISASSPTPLQANRQASPAVQPQPAQQPDQTVQAATVPVSTAPAESPQPQTTPQRQVATVERAPAPEWSSAPTQVATTIAGQRSNAESGQSQTGGDSTGSNATPERAVGAAVESPSSAGMDDQGAQFLQGSAAASPRALHVEAAQAADVAGQIARHVDLYRLPGGHGVRIQLQPEGLGTVDVTVRYGPGHSVEMHVAVDNGSTGALVQAGWANLRDALVAQGFSADRLVMSVASPTNDGSGLFSGQNGGDRPDANAMAFDQQPGGHQSGDERPNQSSSRQILGSVASSESTEDVRAAAEPSRIDYRV